MDAIRRQTCSSQGYELVTNQVSINLKLTHANLLTEAPDSKCPPRTLIHTDLDGNMDRGLLPECLLTSGSTRAQAFAPLVRRKLAGFRGKPGRRSTVVFKIETQIARVASAGELPCNAHGCVIFFGCQ